MEKLKACPECGQVARPKHRQVKKQLSQELCKIMGWNKSFAWSVQNQALRTDILEDIIKRLNTRPALDVLEIAQVIRVECMKHPYACNDQNDYNKIAQAITKHLEGEKQDG